MVGVVAAAAELVPALGAAEVHAATFGQSILEPAVGTRCHKTTQKLLIHTQKCNIIIRVWGKQRRERSKLRKTPVLTDAVVPQISSQALPLVFRVVLPLPQLELLTGQILVLRLPLRAKQR